MRCSRSSENVGRRDTPLGPRHATTPVRLLDLDSFVRHYVEVYGKADDETRSILPLTRIW